MIQPLIDGGRLSDKKLTCTPNEGTGIMIEEVTQ